MAVLLLILIVIDPGFTRIWSPCLPGSEAFSEGLFSSGEALFWWVAPVVRVGVGKDSRPRVSPE